MARARFAFPMLVVLIAGGWLVGQDKVTTKYRGQLPANWGKLGLTDEQKQKIYEIQTKVREKTEELARQIRELKEKERKDMETVLTDEQKAALRKILADKAPPEKK